MLWHDSFKELLSNEEMLQDLLKVDNAKSHNPPPLAKEDDPDDDDDDDQSIDILVDQMNDEPSNSLQHLGHFSFPITPRQRTLLLNGEPFRTRKLQRRPLRASSFDDTTLSLSAATLTMEIRNKKSNKRQGSRRNPNRSFSVDSLGKWTGHQSTSKCNASRPQRRPSNEGQTLHAMDGLNSSFTNAMQPLRSVFLGENC